jgi:hypothetical protein
MRQLWIFLVADKTRLNFKAATLTKTMYDLI